LRPESSLLGFLKPRPKLRQFKNETHDSLRVDRVQQQIRPKNEPQHPNIEQRNLLYPTLAKKYRSIRDDIQQ